MDFRATFATLALSVVQASQRVKPTLEQAAAAAVAAADASGTAKAQAAAKKAKKLTPEEMKLMRQQADPNFASKKDGAAPAQPASKKTKQQKESKVAPAAAVKDDAANATEHASAAAQAVPNVTGQELAQQAAGPVAASKSATAGVAAAATGADNAAQQQPQAKLAPGSKRHHGLGFTEEQPSAKRSKQQDGQPAATSRTEENQEASVRAQPAQLIAKAKELDPHASSDATPQSGHVRGSARQGQGSQQTGQGSSQTGQDRQQAGQNQASAGASAQTPVMFTDECTAFIRGLDSKVTEAELKGLLSPCGDIKDVRIVMDKATNRPKVPPSLCCA